MGTLTYPNILANATTADAEEVMENFDEAKSVINGNIDSTNIATGGVALGNMAANSVDGTKIANLAVDTQHLALDAVDGTKIADNSIDSDHYVDGSIDSAHIGNDQVDSQHYAAGSIDNEHFSSECIKEAEIDWSYAGNGVRAIRLGGTSVTNMGTDGVALIRCETTVLSSKPTTVTVTFSTHALDGNPSFQATPTVWHPVGWVYEPGASDDIADVPEKIAIQNGTISNTQATFEIDWGAVGVLNNDGTLYTTWIGPTTA